MARRDGHTTRLLLKAAQEALVNRINPFKIIIVVNNLYYGNQLMLKLQHILEAAEVEIVSKSIGDVPVLHVPITKTTIQTTIDPIHKTLRCDSRTNVFYDNSVFPPYT